MTWYANRIYTDATPAVLARLLSEPALAAHVYRLTGSLPASWKPEAGEVRLPEGGLVVVKEVGAPEVPGDAGEPAKLPAISGEAPLAAGRTHRWYDADDFVSWHALHGPPEIDVSGVGVDEIVEDVRPPAAFLRFLAHLHRVTGAAVTYYACEMWGGDVLLEHALAFADEPRVYVHRSEGTVEIGPSGRRVRKENVLPLALAHHGLHLQTEWFAPHTRGFEWAPYAAG